MGRELYENDEEFRRVVRVCDEALKDVLPKRLISVLYGEEKESGMLREVWTPYSAVYY